MASNAVLEHRLSMALHKWGALVPPDLYPDGARLTQIQFINASATSRDSAKSELVNIYEVLIGAI